MSSPTDPTDDRKAPNARHTMRVVLRDGFRGHTIVITADDRTVLHACDLTTDRETGCAATMAMDAWAGTIRLAVSVTPGNLVAQLDVDLVARPYVTISLIGEATIAFETSAISLL
jgi:hypothetical protein